MAHTSVSNGPSEEFEELADWKYWDLAFRSFPGLRVSFGHFGDTDVYSGAGKGRAENYARLMTNQPGTPGAYAYADSAYFAETLTAPEQVKTRLRGLYAATSNKGNAALSHRLMYGSDWEMLMVESAPYAAFLDRFVKIFDDLNNDLTISDGKLADRFFGLNASAFLGLTRGDETRRRLDRFYATKGVETPIWAAKVDRAPFS